MKAISLCFSSMILVAAVPPAFGQSDVIGSSGQFAQETGMKGAVANRQMADRLYQQALADERAAWSSFPPNVALLSKALTQSKEAKAADDQAKEFARAALHGLKSGSAAGDMASSKYSSVDEKMMRSLSTTSSPYTGQVQSRLGAYGLDLDPDQMVLKTPMGKFPIGMANDKLEQTLRTVAARLGYNPGDVSKGVQEAIRARDAMARAVEANLKLSGANRAVAAGAGGAGAGGTQAGTDGTTAGSASPAGAGSGTDDHGDGGAGSSEKQMANQLAANRKAFLQKMGVTVMEGFDVRADKLSNIFLVVHMRYQSIRSTGSFIETERSPTNSAPVRAPARQASLPAERR